MKILVTGAAGFIGMHTALRLLERGDTVVGIDNLNDYYDPQLKLDRLEQLKPYAGFSFEKMDLADRPNIEALFAREKFDRVVHLAAQAGVRYSITNPHAYGESNLIGFLNILEACRHNQIQHLVYASSSSVYGGNTKMPFSESDSVDHPVSLYAATKKANELMAHTYSHLYRLPTTGLRFFTVYGPWGRPDMAYYSFTENILTGKPIKIFNNGKLKRDFTYIDDIVDGILAAVDRLCDQNQGSNLQPTIMACTTQPYKIYNIGNSTPVKIEDFVNTLENALDKKAVREYFPMQAGDVESTHADTSTIQRELGIFRQTPLNVGIERFVCWYKKWKQT